MENLVRIYNERDRQTLEWLRARVSDDAIVAAVARCTTAKPFVSAVCRQIGLRPPRFACGAEPGRLLSVPTGVPVAEPTAP